MHKPPPSLRKKKTIFSPHLNHSLKQLSLHPSPPPESARGAYHVHCFVFVVVVVFILLKLNVQTFPREVLFFVLTLL